VEKDVPIVMILIVADRTDTLASRLETRLVNRGFRVCFTSETALYCDSEVACSQKGPELAGTVVLDGVRREFSEITGILLRPPRVWWPGPDFDSQDQAFVYHETTATWFHLLTGFVCPVINRFALGWWLQDLNYPTQLLTTLSARLRLPVAPGESGVPYTVGLRPTHAPGRGTASLYVAGHRLVEGAERSAGESGACACLAQRASALRRWQEENGIQFCRLDFDLSDGLRLNYVEVFPQLDPGAGELAERLSCGIAEIFL